MPAFAGEVRCTIYYGTLYDDLNVPYDTGQIADDATKTLEITSAVVWQSTWLSTMRINTVSYQDIVGAQYVRIDETLEAMHNGPHWFSVVGYTNISNKCVELGLLYDPLLTIGIFNIKTINGVLKRWSVADDTPWKYVNSPEPINQIDRFDYSHFRYRAGTNEFLQGAKVLMGFPCDMHTKPIITRYNNGNDPETGDPIYTQGEYPQVNKIMLGTNFQSSVGIDGSVGLTDNLAYYWIRSVIAYNNRVLENYNILIALGVNLPCRGYILPSSDLIVTNSEDDNLPDPQVLLVDASNLYIQSNLPLRGEGTYNNAKSADIGNIFQLYNEVTGDICEINASNLNDTNIEIMVNTYYDGYFAAKFASYFRTESGYSGIVKSAGWQEFNPVSSVGQGVALNAIQNTLSRAGLETQYNNEQRILDTARDNTSRSHLFDVGSSVVGGIAQVATGNIGAGVSALQSVGGTAVNEINSVNMYNANVDNLNASRNHQRAVLNTMGSIGQIAAPSVKMLGSSIAAGNAYTFVVKKTSLSEFDRRRADNFFTAFGYNVDNTILNSPSQLNTRSRFTFVMADDVNIIAQNSSDDLTRIRDFRTVQNIRQRFSAGLRIWKTTPDYDWTIANPIGG